MTLLAETQDCFRKTENPELPIMLVSTGGFQNQDLPMSGNLQETDFLRTCPHLRALLHTFSQPLGRVCLIRTPMPEAKKRSPLYRNQAHCHFYQEARHPIGNDYILLVETRCKDPAINEKVCFNSAQSDSLIASEPVPGESLNLATPQLDILTPEQIHDALDTILDHCHPCLSEPEWYALVVNQQQFSARWQALYKQFGNDYAGEWSYQSALNFFRETFIPNVRTALTDATIAARKAVEQQLEFIGSQLVMFPPAPQRIDRKLLRKARHRKQFVVKNLNVAPQFKRPVFIISAPRAGSTLLFETLSQFREIWSTGEENHTLLEDIAGLHPRNHDFQSNRLNADDASITVREKLIQAFTGKLQNREQQYYLDLLSKERPDNVRFLEKTPKNALRIPFINALFPDALFIHLHRDSRSNVSSLIDGWRSQRFIAYRNLPGFENRHWSFLLTPGWRHIHDHSIAGVAYHQWKTSNRIIQQDLAKLPEQKWLRIEYQDLITQPEKIVRGFSQFAGLEWDSHIQARCEHRLPVSRLSLTKPQDNKWRKHQCLMNFPALKHLDFG